MKSKFWLVIWNLSEWSGIGLGRFAPYVFEQFMGIKGHKIDKSNERDKE